MFCGYVSLCNSATVNSRYKFQKSVLYWLTKMSDGKILLEVLEKLQINLGSLNVNVVRAWFDTDDPKVINFLKFLCTLSEENCLKPEEYEEFEKIQRPIYGKELDNSCRELEQEFPAIFDKVSNSFDLKNKTQELEKLHENEEKLDRLLEIQERLEGNFAAEKSNLNEKMLKLGNLQDTLEKNITELSGELDEKTHILHSKLINEIDVLSTFSSTSSTTPEFLNKMSLEHLDDPPEFHRHLQNLIREQFDVIETSSDNSEIDNLEQKLITSRTEFLRLKFEEEELTQILKEMSGSSQHESLGERNEILENFHEVTSGNLGKSKKFLENSYASLFESSYCGKSDSFEDEESNTLGGKSWEPDEKSLVNPPRIPGSNLNEKLDKILEEFSKPTEESMMVSSIFSVESENTEDVDENTPNGQKRSKMLGKMPLKTQFLPRNQIEYKEISKKSQRKESGRKILGDGWENRKKLEEILQCCFNRLRLRENNTDLENFEDNLRTVVQISNYYGKLSMLIMTSFALFVREEEHFKDSLNFIEKVSRFNDSNRICNLGEVLENYCEKYFENNCAMLNSLSEVLDTTTFEQSYMNINKLDSDLKAASKRIFQYSPTNMNFLFNSVLLKFLISRETNKILAVTPQLRKCILSVCANLDKQSVAIKHLTKLNSSTVKYLKENDDIKMARLIWIFFLMQPEKLTEIDEQFKLNEMKAVRFKD